MGVEIVVKPAGDVCEDRAAAYDVPGGKVLVVADGAGGTSGGSCAADAAIRFVGEKWPAYLAQGAPGWCAAIELIDRELALDARAGETTVLICHVQGAILTGASVGDCQGWLFGEKQQELTAGQRRKPLVGSGNAIPVGFRAERLLGSDVLILASDGLFNYVQFPRIRQIVTTSKERGLADALASAPRLRSGALPDDVSVLVFHWDK